MPLPFRRYYTDLLVKQKNKESKEYEDAMKKNQDPRLMKK